MSRADEIDELFIDIQREAERDSAIRCEACDAPAVYMIAVGITHVSDATRCLVDDVIPVCKAHLSDPGPLFGWTIGGASNPVPR